ncbi:unnamed protein product, partial [Polarella glacialis]
MGPAIQRTSRKGWAATLLATALTVAAEERPIRPPPDGVELIRLAAQPFMSRYLGQAAIDALGSGEASCESIMYVLDWAAQKIHGTFDDVRRNTHTWQDLLVKNAFAGQSAHDWFRSQNYRAFMQPIITMTRNSVHMMDFVQMLALLHGERCFFPKLRDALGPAVLALADLHHEVHGIQLATIYTNKFAFWEDSSDILRHSVPLFDVLGFAAKFADAFSDVRVVLDTLQTTPGQLVLPKPGSSDWQDSSGSFSDMNFLARKFKKTGWHLDHGLVASLLRLWLPPSGWGVGAEQGCHTSIADFGAGSGHYCSLFNKTGEYCCSAFDGYKNVEKLTHGAVRQLRLDVEFDLGRQFDWVMSLEALEHIPEDFEAIALSNLRRHAKHGL